jgi:hypothetical protein
MSLPALSNWESTRTALHQAAQVIGGVKKAVAHPLPNYAHLGLFVVPTGVTTGKLPDGSELAVDFTQQAITTALPGQTPAAVPLAGHTQMTLTDALVKVLADKGHAVQPDRTKITGTSTFDVNPALANEYAPALYSIFTSIARFRARLLGGMSPMVIWPHGFDLSFLWFARGLNEGQDPHLNFGFSPGSAGFPRPYVYLYAHPMPNGLLDVKLPAPARWYQGGWTGAVIDYDGLAALPDHEAALEGTLTGIFAAVSPLVG